MTTPLFNPPLHFLTIPKPHRLSSRNQSIQDDQHQNLAKEANKILDEYDLSIQSKIRSSNGGGRSDWVVLQTERGNVVLKKYKHTIQPATIQHEHSILQYLAQIDFPAPRLLTTEANDSLVTYNNNNYALFVYLEGYHQYHHQLLLPSQAQYYTQLAGQTLAVLHGALEHFNPKGYNPDGFKSRQGERWRELDWYLSLLQDCRRYVSSIVSQDRDPVIQMIGEKANWLQDTLYSLNEILEETAPPRYLIHGDYGVHNLFVKRGAPVVVLDFELASIEWRLIDLTKAMLFTAKNRFGIRMDKMRTFLQSYHKHSSLSAREIRVLPEAWLFFTLRRLIVCWDRYCQKSNLQYFQQSKDLMDVSSWIQSNHEELRSLIITGKSARRAKI
jgi:Ser/Thr protein kinase RdoA (MazF antagonist)